MSLLLWFGYIVFMIPDAIRMAQLHNVFIQLMVFYSADFSV